MNHVAGALTRGRWRTLTLKIQNIMQVIQVIKEMCPLIQSANRIWYFDVNSHLYLPKTEVLYGQFHYEDDPEDSTLRAFKVLKVLYGKNTNYLFVKIAGLGCGYVSSSNNFYASPDAFVRGESTSALTGTYFKTIDRIKESGCGTIKHWSTGAHDVYRYAWSNNKPEGGSVNVVISYDVANKYLNVTTDRRDKYPYPTEEECILDNQVNVIELDDEPIVGEEHEFWVPLPGKVAVTARTEAEAKAKVRKGLDSIIK